VNPDLSGEYGGHDLAETALKSEWAGATFSKDGEWLFVNLYSPGVTLAITGPWQAGYI
ncbi:MAG: phosphatase, partial [Xanthomonadales bacterium]|nr:phosphatase [Xanthomonadales bacterium]